MLLKNTFRNIKKNANHFLTNIFGLTLGITTFIVISLYINHELKYDKHHSKSNRIIRLVHHLRFEGSGENSASCPYPAGELLKQDYPNLIKKQVRLFNNFNSTFIVKSENQTFNENRLIFADSALFEIFDFEFVLGDPSSSFNGPNKIVLTETTAQKYFGKSNPINKPLKINDQYTAFVTGVVKDIPSPSHFQFDMFCSLSTITHSPEGQAFSSWYGNPYWTYFLLDENATKSQVDLILDDFAKKNAPGEDVHSFSTQALTDIHLQSNLLYEIGQTRNINYIWILATIGILVLIMSFINYNNLNISYIKSRIKEISIKKIIGVSHRHLISGVLIESIVVCFLALTVSVIIAVSCIGYLGSFMNVSIDLNHLLDINIILILTGIILISTFISSIYPAIILTSTKPINIIAKRFDGITQKLFSQKLLVTVQFLFSIFLVTGSFIILKQVNYLKEKPLGFNKENILILKIKNTPIAQNVHTFLEELDGNPNIVNKTYMEYLFGYDYNTEMFLPESKSMGNTWQLFPFIRVHENFMETFDIKIVEGRDFSKEMKSDYRGAVLINETMVNHMGWTNKDAIGKRFVFKNNEKVVGVFKDYHNYSLHKSMEPMVIDLVEPKSDQERWATNYVAIKINAANTYKTIESIEQKWKAMAPDTPFNYTFLDSSIDKLYQSETKLGKLVVIFTIITVVLACMGIFAMSIKLAKIKTKEIGIRKVIGAKVSGILFQLNKEFMIWVGAALIISYPISFLILKKWLNDFSYKTDFAWWIYFSVGIIAFFVALLTVSIQSWQAARKNPIEALRYE